MKRLLVLVALFPALAYAGKHLQSTDIDDCDGGLLRWDKAAGRLRCLVVPQCQVSQVLTKISASGFECRTVITDPYTAPETLAAFRGCEGAGCVSAGGRGGMVYEVTSLADTDTAGTLRYCVNAGAQSSCSSTGTAAQCARICVPRVAGVIEVGSSLTLSKPYLTIAGQTAPGGGIALHIAASTSNLKMWRITAHDVVIRYLKVWGNYNASDDPAGGSGSYGFYVTPPAYNVIADHVSILWQTGKAWNVYADTGLGGPGKGPNRTTLSWSIAAESLIPSSTLIGGGGAEGSYIEDADLHHNAFVSFDHRGPMWHGKSVRMVSNLIDNWGHWASEFSGSADIVNNWWSPGPWTALDAAGTFREVLLNDSTTGAPSIFFKGNKSDWNPNSRGTTTGAEADGGWSKLVCNNGTGVGAEQDPCVTTPAPDADKRAARLCTQGESIADCATFQRTGGTAPFPITYADGAAGLKALLLADGGAGASKRLGCDGTWTNNRHAAETRIAWYVNNGQGPNTYPGTTVANAVTRLNAMVTGTPAIAVDGNGMPTIASATPCTDTDHDGMPDAWETAQGLNPNSAADGPLVAAGQVYTNLERYLNGQ